MKSVDHGPGEGANAAGPSDPGGADQQAVLVAMDGEDAVQVPVGAQAIYMAPPRTGRSGALPVPVSPDGRVKITPRVTGDVARRLRLAASVRSRSQSAVVNDVLDRALPTLEEIRAQLAALGAGEGGRGGGGR